MKALNKILSFILGIVFFIFEALVVFSPIILTVSIVVVSKSYWGFINYIFALPASFKLLNSWCDSETMEYTLDLLEGDYK